MHTGQLRRSFAAAGKHCESISPCGIMSEPLKKLDCAWVRPVEILDDYQECTKHGNGVEHRLDGTERPFLPSPRRHPGKMSVGIA
jgi:hypothetical protein